MITLNQHRKHITQTLVKKFTLDKDPKQGLQAFFPNQTTPTKGISIEIQRMRQNVAVDVQRCTDPVRNVFSRSTEKIFIPPYYNEMFDFTSCQRYDETFGQNNMPTRVDATMLLRDASAYIKSLKNKILRAIELQRAQVIQTGVVVLKNGDSIDYKRRAESMRVLTGTAQWSNQASDMFGDLGIGMEFIRNQGLSGATAINAIFGSNALSNFLNNEKVQKQADWRNLKRIEIGMPQFDNVSGLVYHGQIGTKDYMVNIWTYNEMYLHPVTGVNTPYIEPDNVVMISDDFMGNTMFGGIPAIMGDNVSGQYVGPVEGEFFIRDVIDQIKTTWDFIISSAPLVVPYTVDRIYTLKTA